MLNIYILPFCECTKDDKYFYVIFMLQGLFVEGMINIYNKKI